MKICDAGDIPADGARGFHIPGADSGLPLLVARDGAGFRAYVNRCPHTGVNLDWNPDVFMDATGRYLQCATHGALFRLHDGYCFQGPCYGQGLKPVPIRVVAGEILLDDAPEGPPRG